MPYWSVCLWLKHEPPQENYLQGGAARVVRGLASPYTAALLCGTQTACTVSSRSTPEWFLGFSLGFLLYCQHELGSWWREGNLQESLESHSWRSRLAFLGFLHCLLEVYLKMMCWDCVCLVAFFFFFTMLYICKVLQKTIIKYVSFFSFSLMLAFSHNFPLTPYSSPPSHLRGLVSNNNFLKFNRFTCEMMHWPTHWWTVIICVKTNAQLCKEKTPVRLP